MKQFPLLQRQLVVANSKIDIERRRKTNDKITKSIDFCIKYLIIGNWKLKATVDQLLGEKEIYFWENLMKERRFTKQNRFTKRNQSLNIKV